MISPKTTAESDRVRKYIDSFPSPARDYLYLIQGIIQEEVPDAEASISYGMPAWKLEGKPLVYAAGYRHHIGFYATPAGHEAFVEELAGYRQGKGSVQFPLTNPLPIDLIRRMIRFRAAENRFPDRITADQLPAKGQ